MIMTYTIEEQEKVVGALRACRGVLGETRGFLEQTWRLVPDSTLKRLAEQAGIEIRDRDVAIAEIVKEAYRASRGQFDKMMAYINKTTTVCYGKERAKTINIGDTTVQKFAGTLELRLKYDKPSYSDRKTIQKKAGRKPCRKRDYKTFFADPDSIGGGCS